MLIRLHEISEDGKEFNFSKKSGELNEVLSDFVKKDYKVNLSIRPLGSYYELKGEISAESDEVCSRCGSDIELPVSSIFNDMILEKEEVPRNASFAKTPAVGSSENNMEVVYHQSGNFELGEYLREMLGLEIPEYIFCGGTECLEKDDVDKIISDLNKESKIFDEATKTKGHPGLQGLAKLKL